MKLDEIVDRRFQLEDEILDLQDIAFEATVPQEERHLYIGVHWHTQEQVDAAKRRIVQLEGEVNKLLDAEDRAKIIRGRF